MAGLRQVVSINPRAGNETVYNLEVQGEHVYLVGSLGTLVHNNYRVFRAVGVDEYAHALNTGKFSQGKNALMGKWFSDSLEGATRHGDALHGPGKFKILGADITDGTPTFIPPGNNLDGFGPSRYFELDALEGIIPLPIK
ncbi:hypothetical protein [Gimesia aquarii]|uniref:Uncharacterized protein n=1 Tax=Gimesia aquarii TaxID=2527964 RepID=A0A517VXF5_9PLAN|nr:hypothetical protein [Gimesia aquarii]QDT97678.1 hypothetical protein V144x_31580 [Gimesia aquarii]